jgi:hypothetical protein
VSKTEQGAIDAIGVTRHVNGTTATTHASGQMMFDAARTFQDTGATSTSAIADTTTTTIFISDKNKITLGSIVKIDSEEMRAFAVAGDGPGGVTDTMAVGRGFNRTAAVSHTTGRPLLQLPSAQLMASASTSDISLQVDDQTKVVLGATYTIGDPAYNAVVDLNKDGRISATDAGIVYSQSMYNVACIPVP